MNRAKINFLINAVMFLCMAAIAGIGFMMKWILIPGKDRVARYGRNVDLYWLGLDRHQWGTIHLYIGLTLLALTVLHIILHWNTIAGLYRKIFPSKTARWVVGAVFVALAVALIAFPLFVKPEVSEVKGKGRGRGGEEALVFERGEAPATGTRRGAGRGALSRRRGGRATSPQAVRPTDRPG